MDSSSVRVLPEDVEAIMSSQSFDLWPFIEVANKYVDNQLSSTSLDDETLTQIEKFLAAHFATVRSPLKVSVEVEDAREEYRRASGSNLNSTEYGQVAVSLDTTGTLVSSMKPKAKIESYDILTEDYT